VEFRDDREGNLFLSVVPRQGTQKMPQGTQKTSKEPLQGTQKNGQEPLQGTQKLPQGTQKTSKEPLQGTQKSPKRVLKTSREILEWMRADPHITLTELCEKAGVSIKAIKKRIQVLKVRGLLRRIGPDKGGNWEVLTPSESD
jgi:ATP-dependent DNA helicase RecG